MNIFKHVMLTQVLGGKAFRRYHVCSCATSMFYSYDAGSLNIMNLPMGYYD